MALQLAYLIVAFLMGLIAYRLAVQRGRSPWGWMVASVLFVFPALILALLPPKPSGAA